MSRHPPRSGATAGTTFRPTIVLTLLYLAAFLFLFALVLVFPVLLPLFQSSAPDLERQDLAMRAAHDAMSSRTGLAFGLAVLATTLGVWLGVLPGLRRR